MKRSYYIIRAYNEERGRRYLRYLSITDVYEWSTLSGAAYEFDDYATAVNYASIQSGDCEVVHIKERIAFQFKH